MRTPLYPTQPDYLNFSENALDSIKIQEWQKSGDSGCFICDKNTSHIYKGFVLEEKTQVKTCCDITFYPSKSSGKFIPRITFFKTSLDFETKTQKEKQKVRVAIDTTIAAENFWKMINFLNKFKLLVDIEDFEKTFQVVDKTAYIPLDKPFEKENAVQIKALFALPEKQSVVNFILSNNVIPEELELGLQAAKRMGAIKEFEIMLNQNLTEAKWQKWFENNNWVLGSEFVRILDERSIDTKNITDFLMEAYDGFLDIIEIKRPEGGMTFWANSLDHGNYIPSTDLIKAVTQASAYIFEVEREANSNKFLEKVDNVKTVKPRCILIFGRSNDWNEKQKEAFRILNSGYHNLSIMTYDHVLERAQRIAGNKSLQSNIQDDLEDEIPF